MYEFVADQVLGISGLINLSNIVFLVAFSVRDVLWLRILAIVGEGLTLPYYYFQGEKLWPPIVWGAAFMLVNAVRVVAMALERRPVVLSDMERFPRSAADGGLPLLREPDQSRSLSLYAGTLSHAGPRIGGGHCDGLAAAGIDDRTDYGRISDRVRASIRIPVVRIDGADHGHHHLVFRDRNQEAFAGAGLALSASETA